MWILLAALVAARWPAVMRALGEPIWAMLFQRNAVGRPHPTGRRWMRLLALLSRARVQRGGLSRVEVGCRPLVGSALVCCIWPSAAFNVALPPSSR